MVGGHHTYARVPLGFWAQDAFDLVLATCLAVSAFYELLEWWAALLGGAAAADFLGTQGDPRDTQWDMFLAGVGALAAQLALARLHDAQLARLAAAR
jgi:putative membrane protein